MSSPLKKLFDQWVDLEIKEVKKTSPNYWVVLFLAMAFFASVWCYFAITTALELVRIQDAVNVKSTLSTFFKKQRAACEEIRQPTERCTVTITPTLLPPEKPHVH